MVNDVNPVRSYDQRNLYATIKESLSRLSLSPYPSSELREILRGVHFNLACVREHTCRGYSNPAWRVAPQIEDLATHRIRIEQLKFAS